MGKLGVENAVKLVKVKSRENIDTGAKLITKDNAKEHKEYLQIG